MGKRTFDAESLRTFAVVGHRSSGKTSLADVMLFLSGVTRQIGRVDARTSLLDYTPTERHRGLTMSLAFCWFEWAGCLFNLVDSPGYEGLANERRIALAGVDAAFVVVGAQDGIELGTEQAFRTCRSQEVPCAVLVSKMDRGPFQPGLISELSRAAGIKAICLQLPIFEDDVLVGVASLFERCVYRFHPDGSGAFSEEPVPTEMLPEFERAWDELVESVALTDDTLLEHYLEYLELPEELVRLGLKRAFQRSLLLPVLLTSSASVVGVQASLDFVDWAFPDPIRNEERSCGSEFSARLVATQLDSEGRRFHVLRVLRGQPKRGGVWKANSGASAKIRKLYHIRGPRRCGAFYTGPGAIVATWERLSGRPGSIWGSGEERGYAMPTLVPANTSWLLRPDTDRDARGLPEALDLLLSLDAGVRVEADPVTGGPILSGVDEGHLERCLEIIESPSGISVRRELPPVSYREVPLESVSDVQGVHLVKNEIMVQEYGECVLSLNPLGLEASNRFVDAVDPNAVPAQFVPAIEDGVRVGLQTGPTAGYPVIGAQIRCTGGEYDVFMSTDEHFRLAGVQAVQKALERTGSKLVEPWSSVELEIPQREVGGVLNDVASHRGRVLGLDVVGENTVILAHYPDREIRTLARRIRSLTSGRGCFRAAHSHYGWLPASLVKEAVEASPHYVRRRRVTSKSHKTQQNWADSEDIESGGG